MNRNAYEIRLDVLNLAHGDLMTHAHESLNASRYTKDNEGNLVEVPLSNEALQSFLPKSSDIIARAKELYAFVEAG